jgi:tetratricopeptide (TPR) repeat protein/tRNA A-37 threonylcarbamoyl transferase component Bud32
MNERDIFHAAIEVADADERSAYLEKACAGNAALKQHVESMLQVYPQLGAFLESPAADLQGAASSPRSAGRFQLGEELARGGMGIVYSARDDSLGRDVAVKVLHERYRDDSLVGQRFLDEACITAQLQHPGIPPMFEVGRLADGRPYLAMKLIKGRTLDDLLKERPEPASDRGRFLAMFEQICQAVAYAHSHKVIHRDLKPANVMVGAFAEVQVMDWGVAKLLSPGGTAAREPAADMETTRGTVIQTSRQSDSATLLGSMLGTPAFMAPEQAGGELDRLDERTDVFGLGAILCVILTGEPPYTAKSGEAVRLMAIRGKLADAFARLEQCGADAKLVALCRECLLPERDARPRDAGAVAATVHDYLAGVEERARQAELERAAAEARAAEQRKRRRMLLAASGTIALVLLVGLSVSLWQMRRALLAEATAESNADQARLNAEEADRNAKQAQDEANAKTLALAAEKQARADETKARQQAFAALRSMTDEVIQRKFAQGTVLTEADRAFLRGIIAQFDAFAAIKGDDADSARVRAEARFRVGAMRYKLGEVKEAQQDYDQAVSIYKQLSAQFSSRPEFRQELARCHNNRGVLLRETGRLPEAKKDYDEALNIQKQLAGDFPSRPEFRQQLAISHDNRGFLLSATGRLPEAEKDYDKALNIRKQLVDEFPSRPKFRHELGFSYNNRGFLLAHTGRLPEAEKDYDKALTIRKQLADEFPNRPEFRQDLAISLNNRGILLRDTGRLKEAEKDYGEALRIRKELAADFPSRPEFRQQLAISHNNRGQMLSEFFSGRLLEAEKDLDDALGIQKQLTADFPSRPEFRQDLARSHHNRGLLLRATGKLPQAEKDFDQAVSILKQLSAEFPNRPEFRQELANSHNSRASLQYIRGRLKEAEKDSNEALSIQRQLSARFPNRPDMRNELAISCVNLAILHLRQGNSAAAKRLLLEGRPHHLAVLKANPRDPTYRRFYRNHLSVLTEVHAGLLEQQDAVRTAETRRDVGWNAPADAYDAARFLGRCVLIVVKHDKLDDKQRQEAAQFYGDAAMKLLRDAVSKGFKGVAHMKKNTDLDPLRQREDFQKLVAHLEGKGLP